jgi:hypothetical protein
MISGSNRRHEFQFAPISVSIGWNHFNRQPQSTILIGWRAMKDMHWTTYRTRFLVKAKQLSSSLSFTDSLGRHHSGRKGDYLVESSDGVLRIAPRRFFEDVYVPMAMGKEAGLLTFDEAALIRRKQPQPCRDRRSSGASVGLGLN